MRLPCGKAAEKNVERVARKSTVLGAQSRLLETGADADFVSDASTGTGEACPSRRGCEEQIVTSSARRHIMREALRIAMLGFPERFPVTTASDPRDETERLAKAPLIFHASPCLAVQESGLFYEGD